MRGDLSTASDAEIEEAVRLLDPMVLRGLLYQLTGDESIAETPLEEVHLGMVYVTGMPDASARARIHADAARFLKAHRDRGAPEVRPDPARWHRSLELTAGEPIPDEYYAMWLEQVAFDPFGRTFDWHGEPPAARADFQVVVVGAGMAGLTAAMNLKRAGIPFRVVEKNPEVGGTWYENRYPGARVDSSSRAYSHIFGIGYDFKYNFNPQKENLDYLKWVADHFGLREHIDFDTEVKSMIWDEAEERWAVTTAGADGAVRTVRPNAIISCVGFLSRPNLPDIAGLADFAGEVIHTARWPDAIDLSTRSVALIGTGASGYQLVPGLSKQARRLRLFQRTPSWCFDVPGYLKPLPPEIDWLNRNFPLLKNFTRFRLSWASAPHIVGRTMQVDPAFEDEHARSPLNKRIRDQRVAFVRRKLASRPELIEKMIPKAPPLSSRWTMVDPDDNVFDALLRDNVELVTDRIDRIEPDAIVTADGARHPTDTIVLATGFKANDFLWPMEIRGRGGRAIGDLWAKDGARAYVGTMLPGFPNFFMLYGPNSNGFAGLQIVDFEEVCARFAVSCIAGLIERGKSSVEVSEDAYWRYNDELDRCETRMIYKDPRVKSYYTNEHGRSAANCSIDFTKIWWFLRDPVRPAGAEMARLPEQEDFGMQPWFGQDLIVA